VKWNVARFRKAVAGVGVAVPLLLVGIVYLAQHSFSALPIPSGILAGPSNVADKSPSRDLQLIWELETPGPVMTLVWSSDGTKLAAGSIGQPVTVPAPLIPPMRLANIPDRSTGTSDIAFSPDGSMIAFGSHGTAGVNRPPTGPLEFVPLNNSPLRLFKIDDGARVAEYGEPPPLRGGLAWSPDGRFILFVTEQRTLHVWSPFETENSERTANLSHTGDVRTIALSPDGARLAVGVGQNVRVYQIAW
jgi:WD40 repeat protein